MAGARHRRPSRDLTLPPHGPDQALSPWRRCRGHRDPGPGGRGGGRGGPPGRGYRADLTVFADDPLAVADTDLAALPVLLTVVDGRPTHRDAAL
ncbi:hypothetical protein [Streptomyces sp. CA-132043]|uniref:hypothetical protein n=1 Tax=Streptomyces sp. CA-132043 TaxID=3240048 RepID=UPI003D91CBA5